MTPEDLLKLANKATKSGSWVISWYGEDEDGNRGVQGIDLGEDDFIETDGACYGPNPNNARLIALAPDLARLCAEMGQWLGGNTMRHHEFIAKWLAKFADLEVRG